MHFISYFLLFFIIHITHFYLIILISHEYLSFLLLFTILKDLSTNLSKNMTLFTLIFHSNPSPLFSLSHPPPPLFPNPYFFLGLFEYESLKHTWFIFLPPQACSYKMQIFVRAWNCWLIYSYIDYFSLDWISWFLRVMNREGKNSWICGLVVAFGWETGRHVHGDN